MFAVLITFVNNVGDGYHFSNLSSFINVCNISGVVLALSMVFGLLDYTFCYILVLVEFILLLVKLVEYFNFNRNSSV